MNDQLQAEVRCVTAVYDAQARKTTVNFFMVDGSLRGVRAITDWSLDSVQAWLEERGWTIGYTVESDRYRSFRPGENAKKLTRLAEVNYSEEFPGVRYMQAYGDRHIIWLLSDAVDVEAWQDFMGYDPRGYGLGTLRSTGGFKTLAGPRGGSPVWIPEWAKYYITHSNNCD